MIVDGELIPEAGAEFVKNYAHLPILSGVASREWAHKKRKFKKLKLVILGKMLII